MSAFDIPESHASLTPDQIREVALAAAAKAIQHAASTEESLTIGSISYADEVAIRTHMGRIARQVAMGGVL